MKKRLIALLLAVIMLFSIAPFSAFAETKLSEIRLTSSTSSVQPGSLPEYSITSSTAAVQSISEYSSYGTYWAVWSQNDTAWRGCNAQNPAVAVNDGITHYAMRVQVNLKSDYAFDEETKIYFNGTDITSLGHTGIDAFSWGGNIYIDLGTAGAEKPKYTVSFDSNGGSGTMPSATVFQGESVRLPKCAFTPPAGMSFVAWQIGGKEYKKYSYYTPGANVTAKAIWTDKYIRQSKAVMTPASINNTICANDLVFTSSEPSKYTVSLWRVFDLTDSSLNTDNLQYPKNKNFVSGHKYAIEFEFAAVGNYYEYDETDNISTFSLNGKNTDISAAIYLTGSVLRRVELTANEQTIKQIAATVDNPVAGNQPSSKPVISTSFVSFGDYDWYENGIALSKWYDSFQAGHTYTLKIRANTTKSFSDSVTATINGKVATIENSQQNTILFSLEFTLPGGSYTLKFNSNGGSGIMNDVTGVSGYYTLPGCTFTPPAGKQFKCWVVGGVEKSPYNTVNITANTIITAIWKDAQHQHSYSLSYNEDYHWLECSCGEKNSFEEHSFDNSSDTSCNVCGYVRKTSEHTHSYTITASNEDYHWLECSCGEKVAFEEHSFNKTKSVAASSTALGYTLHSCSCGFGFKDKYIAPTGKQTLKHSARTANAIKVQWNNVKTATGYQIQISTKDGKKWSTYADVKAGTTSYTFKNLAAANNYKFRVRFFITVNGKRYYSPWCKTLNSPTLPSSTTISKLTPGSKAFSAQWKKAGFTGYQIQYSLKSNFSGAKKVTIKNAKTLKTTVKKLSAKKTYFVRIRTYKTISGVNYFSTWSKTYKVKTK